jgi:hypothetical protein
VRLLSINCILALEFETGEVHRLDWDISVYENILPYSDHVTFYGLGPRTNPQLIKINNFQTRGVEFFLRSW